MGDMGDIFREHKEHVKERRRSEGVPCAECVRLLPKANPSILLPGQKCRLHDWRAKESRPRNLENQQQIKTYERR